MPRRRSSAKKTRSRKPELGDGEYTIDQLARRTSTTVRNIRAYQDRGILPKPERRGRVGVYSELHVSRLQLINNMLDRGFSIENIRELLEAWQQGRDLGDLLGLEHAITHVFTGEQPRTYTLTQLIKMFGLRGARKSLIDAAVDLEILKRKGRGFVAASPSLVEAAAELTDLGMPFDEMLDLVRLLRGNVQRAADGLVDIAFKRFDTWGDDLVPNEELGRVSELIWRLRPIAHTAIRAEAEMALTRAVEERLGERLTRNIQRLAQTSAESKDDTDVD